MFWLKGLILKGRFMLAGRLDYPLTASVRYDLEVAPVIENLLSFGLASALVSLGFLVFTGGWGYDFRLAYLLTWGVFLSLHSIDFLVMKDRAPPARNFWIATGIAVVNASLVFSFSSPLALLFLSIVVHIIVNTGVYILVREKTHQHILAPRSFLKSFLKIFSDREIRPPLPSQILKASDLERLVHGDLANEMVDGNEASRAVFSSIQKLIKDPTVRGWAFYGFVEFVKNGVDVVKGTNVLNAAQAREALQILGLRVRLDPSDQSIAIEVDNPDGIDVNQILNPHALRELMLVLIDIEEASRPSWIQWFLGPSAYRIRPESERMVTVWRGELKDTIQLVREKLLKTAGGHPLDHQDAFELMTAWFFSTKVSALKNMWLINRDGTEINSGGPGVALAAVRSIWPDTNHT